MRRKGYLIIICCLLLVIVGLLYSSVNATSVDPGTIQDPLVTKSYVDEQMNALIEKIGELQMTTGSNTDNQSGTADVDLTSIYADIDAYIESSLTGTSPVNNVSSKFEVLGLEAGTKLICSESSEVILRAGSATAIANEGGNGITDVTSGADLIMGVDIPKNHLLIIPRTDGRGIQIVTDAWVMVKGDYTISDK